MKTQKQLNHKLRELRKEWASLGCSERRILNKQIKLLEWCLNLESNETYLVKPRHIHRTKCLFCNKTILAQRKTKKFCSQRCQKKYYYEKRKR